MIVSTGTIMNSTWGYAITSSILTVAPANTQGWNGTNSWASWNRPALAPNGHMYMAPGTSTCVIKIITGSVNSSTSNYSTSTIEFISASSDGGTLFLPGSTGASSVYEKFYQLILAPNGKMYAVDYAFRPSTNNIGYIIEVDPSTDTYRTQSFTYPANAANRALSPALGIDGYLYWMIQSATGTNATSGTFRIYRFDTNSGPPFTVQSSSILNNLIPGGSNSPSYPIGSLAPNGRIYFIPRAPITSSNFFTTRNVAICVSTSLFNPGTTNGISSIALPPEIVGTAQADIAYWVNSTGLDNCIYYTPRFLTYGTVSPSNAKVLKLDPNGGDSGTGSFTLVGPALSNSTANNQISMGYLNTLNGDIFGFPLLAWNNTFNIVPSGSSPTVISSSVYPISNFTSRGIGGFMSLNGKYIYADPTYTVANTNLRFTSSFFEFFSVKGNYSGVTNFSIKDTDLFTPPTPISNLSTSRYNWYSNGK